MLSRAAMNGSDPWHLQNEPFEDMTEFVMLDDITGLRVSEALTLEFADGDCDRRVLRLSEQTATALSRQELAGAPHPP
jgi:integrase